MSSSTKTPRTITQITKKASLALTVALSVLTPITAHAASSAVLKNTNIEFGPLMNADPVANKDQVLYHISDNVEVRYSLTTIRIGDEASAMDVYRDMSADIGAETVSIEQYELDGRPLYIGIFCDEDSKESTGTYACLQDVGMSNYVAFSVSDKDYSGKEDAVNACFNIAESFPGKTDKDILIANSPAKPQAGTSKKKSFYRKGTAKFKMGKDTVSMPKSISTPQGDYTVFTAKRSFLAYTSADGNVTVSYSDSYIKTGDAEAARSWMKSWSGGTFSEEYSLNGKRCYVVKTPPSSSTKDIRILQDVGAEDYVVIHVTAPENGLTDVEAMEAFGISNEQ